MKYSELLILLPCHSLEDFPTHYTGDEAEGLLAAWSALWHPALLASARAVPTWCRADAPPDIVTGKLLVAPQVSQEMLLAGFAGRCKSEGAVLIRKTKDRSDIVAQSLAALDGGAGGVNADLAADFLALGYCRLHVELLTRHMRYTSNIDETFFQNEALAAADAAMNGDYENAVSHLGQCFDVLNESRKHYYPVDAYLVDLTLVAPTTIGESLRRELAPAIEQNPAAELGHVMPLNLLLTGQTLREIAAREPATLAKIQEASARGVVCVVGGEDTERDWPLLPIESIRNGVGLGIAEFERILGQKPTVYGRRRFGLSPIMPQVLSKSGFQGALHFTLDDGRFPIGQQSKSRWEGCDGSVIDALLRVPRDASQSETFLDFSRKLGESMDMDHVATVVFAHWPGQANRWYDDLRRIARYTTALGKFIKLDDYFAQTDMPGSLSRFEADEYRSPYLKQAIIRRQVNPISSIVTEHVRRAAQDAEQAVACLAQVLGAPANGKDLPWGRRSHDTQADTTSVDRSETQIASDDGAASGRLATAMERISAAIPRSSGGASSGYLVVNPCSFARRIGVELPQLSALPAVESPIHSAGQGSGGINAVVDVPAMGFAWVAPATGKPGKAPKPLAEENILRNEFVELVISRATGGIQSIHDYRHRSNRLSQQIALRSPGPRQAAGEAWRDPDESAVYTQMVADSVEIANAGPALGEIVSRGGLLDAEGRRVAEFKQTTQLWFGSRVIVLKVELDPKDECRADPWNSYYGVRFAWPDHDVQLHRSVNLGRVVTDAKKIEATHFVEIEMEKGRTAILTAGLPYHRRSSSRMLDSLLIARGETARSFTLGIGVDLAHPAQAALDLLAPTCLRQETNAPPTTGASWLFHVDAKNIVATHWEPLVLTSSDTAMTAGDAMTAPTHGFCVRLLETEGKAGRATLRALRPLAAARQVDFQGQPLLELPIEDDKIVIDIGAHEWLHIEARWK